MKPMYQLRRACPGRCRTEALRIAGIGGTAIVTTRAYGESRWAARASAVSAPQS